MTFSLIIGVLSLLCVYLEFFLPGGILASIGVLLLLGGSVTCFFELSSFLYAGIYFLIFLSLALGICFLALKQVKKSGRKDSFFLQTDQEGYTSADKIEDLSGKEGVVATELKPAGHVRIEGRLYQATSQGSFLAKETAIEVVEVRGAHLIVKPKN